MSEFLKPNPASVVLSSLKTIQRCVEPDNPIRLLAESVHNEIDNGTIPVLECKNLSVPIQTHLECSPVLVSPTPDIPPIKMQPRIFIHPHLQSMNPTDIAGYVGNSAYIASTMPYDGYQKRLSEVHAEGIIYQAEILTSLGKHTNPKELIRKRLGFMGPEITAGIGYEDWKNALDVVVGSGQSLLKKVMQRQDIFLLYRQQKAKEIYKQLLQERIIGLHVPYNTREDIIDRISIQLVVEATDVISQFQDRWN
jgi:hypothetical protein